ncbi:HAD hydrolase, subfamily IA, Pyrimidine 5-nucleotidase [Artemisia annua]|uniref:HAD hydrolase, subfamily IA, Pyrimidine 5-nucleotidase n=1 Tax=Artemisia annua TaxID=35608 RepID=A0A2U1Q3E5_ARTAN|nr:HAD hydrolase, subfamily IA, Pyrimidine 5-nucleotidase [Artemisia annua]
MLMIPFILEALGCHPSAPLTLEIFFDDSIRNIQASKLTGLTTVLVGSSQRKNGVDYALESIHNIREALPELWESVNKTIDVDLSQQIAIETRVEA